MPSVARSCVPRCVRSMPLNVRLPLLGLYSPAMRFTVVLLPEPLGPISPKISPLRTSRSS